MSYEHFLAQRARQRIDNEDNNMTPSFSDEDLADLKESLNDQKKDHTISNRFKLPALLHRLEAAEAVCDACVNIDEYSDVVDAMEAWLAAKGVEK